MSRPKHPGLTENELEIMKILWKQSPLKVSEILKFLERSPKPAYTSLLTLVQTMEKKGYIKHDKEGKAYAYMPILKQKKYLSSEIKRVVNQLFSGNAGELVLNLVKNEQLSKQDIADLKRLLKG